MKGHGSNLSNHSGQGLLHALQQAQGDPNICKLLTNNCKLTIGQAGFADMHHSRSSGI
ncbi:MAG: hypothetical protein JWR05_636 [Mucilaginibacter sp.]|nr:hypothetical protein [Mucilaginibacter sp.]